MILLAGLGNPGEQYRKTRHNIGFLVIETISRHHHFSAPRLRFHGQLSEGMIAGQKVLGFQPQTFMNMSGMALLELSRYFDIALNDIVVFYDELDLPLGKLRIRKSGGANGHNGLGSCIAHLGQGFRRIRLGIGHPGDKTLVDRHVLGHFSKAEMALVQPWIEAVAQYSEMIVRGQDNSFANKLHLAMAEHGAKINHL